MKPGIFRRFSLLAALALAACTQDVAVQELPEMTFNHLDPINLRVVDMQFARNEVLVEHPEGTREVGPSLPTPPDVALRRWAQDRLKPAGASEGTARFTILRATVTRTDLETETGVTSLFKKQVNERYDAAVEAILEVLGTGGIRRAVVSAEATRTLTVREDESVASRRRILYEMMERLMADFDKQMEENIRRNMTEWLL